MKRILSVLSLVLITAVAQAQTLGILRANITNFRTYNNTQITTKTGPRSITPINVGGNIDSAMRYIDSALNYTASVGDWQSSLSINNIATISPYLTGGALYEVAGTGTERAQLAGGNLLLWSSGGGGFYGRLKSNVTTSNKAFYLPDFASGNSTADALVTHVSNSAVTVQVGSAFSSMLSTSMVSANGTGALGAVAPNLLLLHNASNPSGAISASLQSDVLSASRIYYLPDESAGNTTDDAIVLHKTATDINVISGVNSTNVAPTRVGVSNSSTAAATLVQPNKVVFHNPASGGGSINTNLYSKPVAGPSSVDHYLNEYGGDISCKYVGAVTQNPAGAPLVFAHGLPFTPTNMTFTPTNAAAGTFFANYFATYGATNVTLTSTTPGAAVINFSWRAEP